MIEANEKYNIDNISIQEIKSRIEELNNKLEFFLNKKEQVFELTQPKAKELKAIMVEGGSRTNLFDKYVMVDEELDPIIDFLQEEINLCELYLKKELERINKYDEWEQKVILMRQEGQTWLYIACNTPFSIRTCQRIYRKYLSRRDIS